MLRLRRPPADCLHWMVTITTPDGTEFEYYESEAEAISAAETACGDCEAGDQIFHAYPVNTQRTRC